MTVTRQDHVFFLLRTILAPLLVVFVSQGAFALDSPLLNVYTDRVIIDDHPVQCDLLKESENSIAIILPTGQMLTISRARINAIEKENDFASYSTQKAMRRALVRETFPEFLSLYMSFDHRGLVAAEHRILDDIEMLGFRLIFSKQPRDYAVEIIRSALTHRPGFNRLRLLLTEIIEKEGDIYEALRITLPRLEYLNKEIRYAVVRDDILALCRLVYQDYSTLEDSPARLSFPLLIASNLHGAVAEQPRDENYWKHIGAKRHAEIVDALENHNDDLLKYFPEQIPVALWWSINQIEPYGSIKTKQPFAQLIQMDPLQAYDRALDAQEASYPDAALFAAFLLYTRAENQRLQGNYRRSVESFLKIHVLAESVHWEKLSAYALPGDALELRVPKENRSTRLAQPVVARLEDLLGFLPRDSAQARNELRLACADRAVSIDMAEAPESSSFLETRISQTAESMIQKLHNGEAPENIEEQITNLRTLIPFTTNLPKWEILLKQVEAEAAQEANARHNLDTLTKRLTELQETEATPQDSPEIIASRIKQATALQQELHQDAVKTEGTNNRRSVLENTLRQHLQILRQVHAKSLDREARQQSAAIEAAQREAARMEAKQTKVTRQQIAETINNFLNAQPYYEDTIPFWNSEIKTSPVSIPNLRYYEILGISLDSATPAEATANVRLVFTNKSGVDFDEPFVIKCVERSGRWLVQNITR